MERKLYCDMTRREKRVYCGKMLADWIRAGCEVLLAVQLPRCVRNGDGWYYRNDWCVYDCESRWHPIDLEAFYAEMGIVPKGGYPLHAVLREAGYDAHDVGGAVVILGRKGNGKQERK